MKKKLAITCCGMFSALAAVIMLVSYFPSLTYAVPAVAGVIFIIPYLEFGAKYAWICYAVSSLITLLTAETEAKVLYICFFGFYPIISLIIAKIKHRTVKYIIKFAVFNVSVILAYTLIIFVFGIPFESGFGLSTQIFAIILLVAGNVVFFIYDFAIDRLYMAYCFKWRKTVRKILRLGNNK